MASTLVYAANVSAGFLVFGQLYVINQKMVLFLAGAHGQGSM